MMNSERQWFKYCSGFVNIDETCFYLTKTGNWSEVGTLTEKTIKTEGKKELRNATNILFALVISVVLIALVLIKLSDVIKGVSFVTLGFVAYKLYQYMMIPSVVPFKIPLHKISLVEINGKVVLIQFENGHDQTDTQELQEVEEKGIKLIKEKFSM